MKFIRENLFLLVLIGVVAVLGGILTYINFSWAEDRDREITERDAIIRGLQRHTGGARVSPKLVEYRKDLVESLCKEANEVIRIEIEKDQAAHPVLQVPVEEPGREKRYLPAFPYDARQYTNLSMTFQFIREHRKKTAELLEGLRPTTPPTVREIEEETRKQEALLRRFGGFGTTRPAAPSGTAEFGGLGAVVGAPGAGAAADLATEAKRRAIEYEIHYKATRGHLYIDDGVSAAITFGPDVNIAPDEIELWRKQFWLWIASDVVRAIQVTNKDRLAKVPAGERNVLGAAVKRLYALKIDSTYAFSDADKRGGTTPIPAPGGAPPSGGPPSGGPPSGGLPFGGLPSGGPPFGGLPSGGPPSGSAPPPTGMGGPPAGWGPARGVVSSGAPQATGTIPLEDSYTQHFSTPERDVIRYSFSVVMPTRHVLALTKNIEANSRHVVVLMRWEEAPKDTPPMLCNYSNEPVLLVTFACEAHLLTQWSRDLVPTRFLATIPDAARREQDKQRVAGGTPATPE